MPSHKRSLEPSEHQLQAAFVEWVRSVENLPGYAPLRLSFAVPNGARTSISQGKKLKAEGMRAGVCDWWLPWSRGSLWDHLGLALEFKTKKGVLSKEQRDYIKLLRDAGWDVEVCRSTERAIAVVRDYLGIGVIMEAID